MSFVTFSLLTLASRPALAQGPGGGWTAVPCDASGNILSNPASNSDGYVMGGTESGKDHTTCPLFHSYDTATTIYKNAPTPSGIGNYGSGGNEALVVNGSDYYWYGQIYGTNTYAIQNGTETVDLNGQLVYFFKEVWQGSGAPTTPMPDHIDLRLKTTVWAFAYVDYYTSPQTWGLSAQATASDGDPFNESVSASASTPDASVLYQQVGGYHLVRASVSGGIAEVNLNGTVHMEADNTVPYGVLSYPMPGDPSYVDPTVTNGPTQSRSSSLVAGSVRQDDREVMITCPAIEDSYYKATNPDPTHGDRYQHLRDPITGAIVTDSVATYSPSAVFSTMDNTKPGAWIASDTFTANTPGFQNPSYAWSGDFSGPGMADVDLTQKSVNGNWFFGSSSNLPKQSMVRVDVTDGPPSPVPATASNTFGITWHLPYEAPNPVPYSVVPGKYQVQPARLGPVSYDQTQLKKPTEAQHIDWEAAINGASVVAEVGGQEEIAGGLEIVEAIAKIAKPYTDVDADSNTETGATNNAETWSDSMKLYDNDTYGGGNIPADLQGDPDGYLSCDMYIYQVVHYKDKYWYADGYNSHGYDGTSNNVVYLRNIDGVSDEFYYVRRKPSGAGASPVPPTPMQSVSDQPAAAE